MYAEFFNHHLSFGPDCGRRRVTFLLLLPPRPHLYRKQQIVFIEHVPVTSTFSHSLNPCNSLINLVVLYSFDRWEH